MPHWSHVCEEYCGPQDQGYAGPHKRGFLLGGSATCPGETGSSRDTWDTTDTGVLAVTDDSAETTPSEHWAVRPPNPGAAMAAVSTATALHARPRPGRRRISRGRPRESRLTSGSRRRGLSRGGGEFWPTGMITKTHKGDLGLGLPEKKKKKKKVVPEPETPYLVLNSDSYFTEACPTKAISSLKNVVHGQALEVPPVKKKKKKKGHSAVCEEPLKPEPKLHAGRTESSPGPRKQVLLPSESLRGERKKRKSTSPCARVRTSPDPRQGEEVTRVGKKLKKHKKEKKAQEATAFSAEDPWLCEAGDASYMCSVGKDGEERAALGQKRKQGSPEEHKVKTKKRKKIRQKGDSPLEHPKLSRSEESCPKKGSKKKPVRDEAPEYIPIGDGPKTPAKKKLKSKKKAEPTDTEKPALKRKKKKKRQESRGAEESWEEEPDTDLEVVLEKKGNMDEAHIDQVRRKALQEEIDRESGKTEAPDTKKCQQGTQFGQWDTAGFENEEQKLKFLKLMGGFKNLSASLGRAPAAAGRPSMALSKQAADALQQNLQRDYDRALSWKHSRGAGLGFSPASDKIFYIDRNASKSVKFGD